MANGTPIPNGAPILNGAYRMLVLMLAVACVGQAAEAEGYAVRLFWRQAPEQIDVAPPQPFTPQTSPLMRFSDGRAVMLRGPLRVRAEGDRLRLGGRFTDITGWMETDAPLRLRAADGPWAEVQGLLRVWASNGDLHAQVRMDTESYVRAVLAGEAGGIRDIEALKAIAVAIRSYAFASGARHDEEGFAFCDTTHCQDLRLANRHPLLDEAVAETEGELLWREGAPVSAWHHADSGGHTEDARAVWGNAAPSWMRGQPDPHSLLPQPFTWSARIPLRDLERALQREGLAVSVGAEPMVTALHASGRAAVIRMGGRTFPASTLRFAIGRHLGWNLVRSDLYELRVEGGEALFTGRGAGHGVGLSQRGAAALARAGKSYREILSFYFSGARVGVGARDIRWTRRGAGLLRVQFAGAVDEGFTPLLSRELRSMEAATGIVLRRPLEVSVYADVDGFRNHTGNPGWVAAGTTTGAGGSRIVLQPLATLRRSNQLEALVRHELVHVLVAQEATRPLPRWFQEGLGRWLAREGGLARERGARQEQGAVPRAVRFGSLSEVDEALVSGDGARRYAAAAVAEQYCRSAALRLGRETVLGWIRRGPPEDDHALLGELQQPRQH
ncbi:MAG: SpoIID/LytB domain-containing protein [Bryobacterales bacterium]|nr:SpoIID/LytB domain-containing protein [Bryobacterales bacterium]